MEAKEKYMYARKEAQVYRANRFVQINYGLFYLTVLVTLWISCVMGEHSVSFCGGVTAVIIVAFALNIISYAKNRTGVLARYIALAGLLAVSYLTAVAFHNYYVRFMACIPLVGSILFFDMKYSATAGILVTLINLAANAVNILAEHKYAGQQAVEQLCATMAIALLVLAIYLTAKVARIYNHDTRHSLMYEQEKQKAMMQNVLSVAEEVRKGTEGTMGIMGELNSSASIVDSSMQDISDSTQSTAESIQAQTEMTQSIQDAIGVTLQHSDQMVQVAKKSEQLNTKSLQMMESLKKQAASIGETNAGVAASMKELQERTDAVKSIADTIFDISSQTNLLALNASIESARAGEAGRGFAVVADEIRQLAEKTRQETESIAGILNGLSNNAQSAAEAVSHSIEAVRVQDEMIVEVSDSFDEINENVKQLIASIGDIDGMLNKLSDSNNQIVADIMLLSSTTQEVTASSAQASELSIQNVKNADAAKEMLSHVLEVSSQLEQYRV